MKIKNGSIFALLALVSATGASALDISVYGSVVDAGKTTFNVSGFAGVITPSSGRAVTLEASQRVGKWRFGADVQYLDIKLAGVTVGGRPKKWAESAQGWYAGAFVSYALIEWGGVKIGPKVAAGWQDMVGSAPAVSAGVFAEKKLGNWEISLGVDDRKSFASNYQGIEMHKADCIFYNFGISRKF